MAVLRLAPHSGWATSSLVALGLTASLAETFGITLVILFLYSALGQRTEGAVFGGTFDQFLTKVPLEKVYGFACDINPSIDSCSRPGRVRLHRDKRFDQQQGQRTGAQRYACAVFACRIRLYPTARSGPASRTSGDGRISSVAAAYTSFTRIIINICAILVFVGFLLSLSWRISVAATIGSLLISFALRALAKPVRSLGSNTKKVNQAMAVRLLITLQGMRTVRAYGQEGPHHAAFVASSQEAMQTSLGLERLYAMLGPATEIGNLLVLCFIVGFPIFMHATLGTTLAAVALLSRLQPHIHQLEGNLLNLSQLGPSLRTVLAMLDRSDKSYPPAGHRPLSGIGEGIAFERVHFSPMVTPGLRQLKMHAFGSRRTTAIVGPSGAGKTTIVNLLLRLLPARIWPHNNRWHSA